jgi:peptide/nickel transport system permease protein
MLLLLAFVAVASPWLAPYGYDDQNLAARLRPPAWVTGGMWTHPLGTDQLGRDMLTRIMYGARASLAVGLSGILTGALLGVLVGLLTGYWGGWLDSLMMRLGDVQLAFPYLLLAIAIMTVVGPSLPALIAVLGLRTWVQYARTVRSVVLPAREFDFVQAAQALGASHRRILAQHIFPTTVSPVIVLATVELANLILLEATLGFLGLGVQPPIPSWGSMLSAGRNYLQTAWWLTVFPGAAIMLAVVAANALGDGLRDALDPHAQAALARVSAR